jgi:hypothetical protein
MSRQSPRRDQHGVEANVLYGMRGIGGKPRVGGCDNARPLPTGDRPRGIVKALARLHFDEDQQLAPARNDIDLANGRPIPTREDAEALGDEEGRSRGWARGRSGSCIGAAILRELQRVLVDFAARAPGDGRDFGHGFLHRQAPKRAAE